MIPIKLRLHNFTSYGTNVPELDFSQFHLAAISGPNGAGKSSLIDAITWALWGESRAGGNADKLVRLGQTQMSVEFEFELEGVKYQVGRKRSLKGGGSTFLELISNRKNLTEGTIKSTQQKISNTLHMDYEIFVNSSYLRQGKADEFTLKPPGERKEILANILGLGSYDVLEEKAKELTKEKAVKISSLEFQLIEIQNELSFKEEREKSLIRSQEEVNIVEEELSKVERELSKIKKEEQINLSKQQALLDKKILLESSQKELKDLKTQIELKQRALGEFQTILEKKEEIEKNYENLKILEEAKKGLEEKRSHLLKHKNDYLELQKVVLDLETRRQTRISQLEIQIKALETKNEQISDQIRHLSDHRETCPTCGQAIRETKQRELLQKNQKELSENNARLKTFQKEVEKCRTFVLPPKKELDEKSVVIKSLETETKPWEEINQKILSFQKYSDLYTKSQLAQASVKNHEEVISDLQKICVTKLEQIKSLEKELQELVTSEMRLREINNVLKIKEGVKKGLSEKSLELRSKVGEARQLVTRTEQLEKLAAQRRGEVRELGGEKEIYEELSSAFGKKGIQALLIETVIPGLEEEANLLLDKLTDGRMKVSFSTQRETKTGGTIETLDIIISDENGSRSYETFSGGESFRVNIAIRLAISRLLTQRAGARLQFLIIDEGFGTQDVTGRDRIIEAINLIRNSFAKIVIITHLEELKEAFPARIEVSKNSEGSTFQVII